MTAGAKPVLIAGGGIGGLAAALGLAQKGIASILLEKGMRLASVREDIVQLLNEKTAPARPKETPLKRHRQLDEGLTVESLYVSGILAHKRAHQITCHCFQILFFLAQDVCLPLQ